MFKNLINERQEIVEKINEAECIVIEKQIAVDELYKLLDKINLKLFLVINNKFIEGGKDNE